MPFGSFAQYGAIGLGRAGMLAGGPPGWAMLSMSIAMQAIMGAATGRMNLNASGMVASLATGVPMGPQAVGLFGLGRVVGGEYGSLLQPLAEMRDRLDPKWAFNKVGMQAAYQGMAMTSPFLYANSDMRQFARINRTLIEQFGSPEHEPFQAAAAALAPAFGNPFLNEDYRGAIDNKRRLSDRAIAATYLALGPVAGARAANAAADSGGLMNWSVTDRFRRYSVGAQRLDVEMGTNLERAGAAGFGAGAASIGVGSAQFTGDPSRIREQIAVARGELSAAEGEYRTLNESLNRAKQHYGSAGYDPLVAQKIASLTRQQSQVRQEIESLRHQSASLEFQSAVLGPSAGWSSRVAERQTDEQIALMDPMRGVVPTATRQGLIADYSARLAEIERNTAGNPAAQAALAGERSQLRLNIAQEQIAARYGLAGQMLHIGAGAPMGYQGLGLQALSLAFLQNHDPGVSPMFGGTGQSMGSGGSDNATIIRLLTEIRDGLNANRSLSSGAAGSAYSTINHRANMLLGGR